MSQRSWEVDMKLQNVVCIAIVLVSFLIAKPAFSQYEPMCRADADCVWDNICLPVECVVGVQSGDPDACAGGEPTPGACICLNSVCAVRPDQAFLDTRPKITCDTDADCDVNLSGGGCLPHEGYQARPTVREHGPYCICLESTCTYGWVDPVPCDTNEDCAISTEPFLHPVPTDGGGVTNDPHAVEGDWAVFCDTGQTPPHCRMDVLNR